MERRWEEVRGRVVARWREIAQHIESHDRGGVLSLANSIDEFCEEAITDRLAVLRGRAPAEPDLWKFSRATPSFGMRCYFCKAFEQAGGCFGLLARLNESVLADRWEDARRVAATYLARLESLDLRDIPGNGDH